MLVIEEMAKACTVTARIVVETNMGAISTVMAYGSEAQKKLAARLVLAGDKPAICITEPEAGSDALAMTTRADKRGDGYVINGKKHWITGAGVSQLHLIFARVFDERGDELGIGGFLAVRDEAKGPARRASANRPWACAACRKANSSSRISKSRPPWRVLPPSGFRRGFADLMNAYNSQRVGAGTVAMGIAAGALELALDWVKDARAVRPADRRIPGPAMDARRHADAAHRRAADALRRRRARAGPTAAPFPIRCWRRRPRFSPPRAAIKIVNDALQMFGARGYSRDLPLERMARDVRMFTIGGGTAQVLRTLVASRMLGWKLPQTRDGYAPKPSMRDAAE